MNRIAIFIFYDPEGKVDKYVEYLLGELKKNTNKLIIVGNGEITEESVSILSRYSKEIIIRENEGFDGGAYKHILLENMGKEECKELDELVLMNDTCYGPFIPFSQMFKEMEMCPCDIWGLTKHEAFTLNGIRRQAHLQSYFLCIKQRVLLSDVFWSFWEDLQIPNDFDSAVSNFEIAFSESMTSSGFTLKSYVDDLRFNSEENGFNYGSLCCGELVEAGFPFLKRKAITACKNGNWSAKKAIDYICHHLSYDEGMIIKNLLRRASLNDLKNSIGLYEPIKENEQVINSKISFGVVFFVGNTSSFRDWESCIRTFSNKHKVWVVLSDASIEYSNIENVEYIIQKGNWINSISELKEQLTELDMICIINDSEKYAKNHRLLSFLAHESIRRNILYNENSLYDIFTYMTKDYEGLIFPIKDTNSYRLIGSYEEKIRNILKGERDSEIKRLLLKEKSILLGDTSFICKPSFLYETIEYIDCNVENVEKWDIFSYILPYVAQLKGICPKFVFNTNTVANEIIDREWGKTKTTLNDNRADMVRLISKLYKDFNIYIYGNGIVGKRLRGYFLDNKKKIEAFIITKKTDANDKAIEISDYNNSPNNLIILGVGAKNKEEIRRELEKYNYNNYIDVDAITSEDFLLDIISQQKAITRKIQEELMVKSLAVEAAPFEYGDKHPRIESSEALLERLISSGESLARFGDGEFQLMQNMDRPWFQKTNPDLAKRLNEVFYKEKKDVIIAIPNIFGNLGIYKDNDATNIRHYLSGENRTNLLNIIGYTRKYYDAYVTRPYLMYKDPKHGYNIFNLFKKIWNGKKVLMIEGEYVRSGVGNDLFDNVKSLERIVCPSRNAFDHYNEIFDVAREYIKNVDIVLCALGPTATVLAYDLSDYNKQVLDIGQLDNEYEWCKMCANKREPIRNKAVPEIEAQHTAPEINDEDYLNQIICRI